MLQKSFSKIWISIPIAMLFILLGFFVIPRKVVAENFGGEGIVLLTDKAEYKKGEPVQVTLKNNSDRIIVVPGAGIEKKRGANTWEAIPIEILCPCGVLCSLVAPLLQPVEQGASLDLMDWDQSLHWCAGGYGGIARHSRALVGEYRVKLGYLHCSNAQQLIGQDKIRAFDCQTEYQGVPYHQEVAYQEFKIVGGLIGQIVDKTPIISTIRNEIGWTKYKIVPIIAFVIIGGLLVLLKKMKNLKIRLVLAGLMVVLLGGTYLFIEDIRISELSEFWPLLPLIGVGVLSVLFKKTQNRKLRIILIFLILGLLILLVRYIDWSEFWYRTLL